MQDELIAEEYVRQDKILKKNIYVLSAIGILFRGAKEAPSGFIISHQARHPDFSILERKLSSRWIAG